MADPVLQVSMSDNLIAADLMCVCLREREREGGRERIRGGGGGWGGGGGVGGAGDKEERGSGRIDRLLADMYNTHAVWRFGRCVRRHSYQ